MTNMFFYFLFDIKSLEQHTLVASLNICIDIVTSRGWKGGEVGGKEEREGRRRRRGETDQAQLVRIIFKLCQTSC